jgi:DNA segregation ATPase FtsK/SpoIIIE, S-DNA-T family
MQTCTSRIEMPLLKPSTPPKKDSKPAGKTLAQKRKGIAVKNPRRKAHIRRRVEPTWWESLSAERKLDVVGIALAFFGIIILAWLDLRQPLRADRRRDLFPFAIIRLGGVCPSHRLARLRSVAVFRKIERIPPLSTPNAPSAAPFYFSGCSPFLHSFVATAETAEAVALTGAGGGALWRSGTALSLGRIWRLGAFIALIAWLIIGVAVMLDKPVSDLFFWLTPLTTKLRDCSKSRSRLFPRPTADSVSENGFTPIDASAMPNVQSTVSVPVQPVQTRSGATIIEWKLPALATFSMKAMRPKSNEEFVQQRARLIEDTLASFGAPAQVVAISRGPTITQFGVEPLFVETRGGVRTRVRVSKIASLSDDLALALAAPRIRIQAPVPGHSYVGIEVPNEEMAMVALRDILESEVYKNYKKPLSLAWGVMWRQTHCHQHREHAAFVDRRHHRLW